jgi:hypothetical protein
MCSAQSKVGDFQSLLRVDQQVRRFEVSVQDTMRMAVCKPFHQLTCESLITPTPRTIDRRIRGIFASCKLGTSRRQPHRAKLKLRLTCMSGTGRGAAS